MNRKQAPTWLARLGTESPQSAIGTKAFNLSILDELGFAVPPCVFIATLHSELVHFESAATYLESIDEFSRELHQLVPSEHGWSVRSSATVEDLPGESHAGRFETLFIEDPAELANAVQAVWDSGQSAGIGPESMGVVVQELIDADFAGVAFSHDPTRQDGPTVIEAVPGNAARFVEGAVAPLRIRSGDGERSLPEDLDAGFITALDEGVQLLADKFGTEVDVEWALANRTLYWLQVRPLTGSSFREFKIPDGQRPKLKGLWVRINHSFAPQVPLVASMNPGGYFDGPGWSSCLVNNFHYIQQEPGSKELVPEESFDQVLDEWDEWERRFERLYDARQRTDLSILKPAELWGEIVRRTELSREYFVIYSDRRFLEIRDRTEQRVNEIIDLALAGESSSTAVLSRLLGQLGSLTEEKQRQLMSLASLLVADRTRNIRKTPQWHEFIESFGFESATTHLFYLPTLKETPDLIIEMINQMSQRTSEADASDDWRVVAESIVARLPDVKGREFMRQLARLRRCMLRTEDDDYALARCTLLVREAYLESGRRLVADEMIKVRDDIFYMTGPELRKMLTEDNARPSRSEIDSRKEEFEQSKLLNPPPMIVNGRAMTPKSKKSEQSLTGTPASPGVASGSVLVLNDPFSCMGKQLPMNSVIVAPIITPALAYSLMGCAALVTEIGGLASHGAIVAREMAIPAVVGVSSARTVLSTGMSVEVNGSTGEINMVGSRR